MRFTIVQTLLLMLLVSSRVAKDALLLFARTELTRSVASALILLSILLAALAFGSLRKAFRVSPEPRRDARLVTSGVYRHLRHPMYTAVALFAIGLFFSKPSASMAIATATLVVFYLIKARHEEKLLSAHYSEYAHYKARSFGVLPLRRGG